MWEFLRLVREYCFLWIRGKPGGGKTTLALKLADMLVARGHVRYTVVNFPLWVDVVPEVTTDIEVVRHMKSAVLILDEAGQFFDRTAGPKQLKTWMSYPRKYGQTVLMSSFLEVPKQAASVQVMRTFNGMPFGLPVWWYTWTAQSGVIKDKDRFAWWFPSEVFGLYDTEYTPDDRWYIYDWQNGGSAGNGHQCSEVSMAEPGQHSSDFHGFGGGGSVSLGDSVLLELSGVKPGAGLSQSDCNGNGGGGSGTSR